MRLTLLNEMKIDKKKLLTLWYENEKGEKYIPKDLESPDKIPTDKYPYQVSQFPNQLTTTYLKCYEDRSEEVMEGHQSWPEDLVMAMANSGDYSLSESILIAASCCERCLNVLLDQYELDGYEEDSEEWNDCGTECEFCSTK